MIPSRRAAGGIPIFLGDSDEPRFDVPLTVPSTITRVWVNGMPFVPERVPVTP